MLKKLFISVILTAIVTLNIQTAQAANTIAIVNITKILKEADAAKAIREQLKNKRDKYLAEITKKEESLRAADKKLVEQRSILSPAAFDKKKKEFKQQIIGIQRDVQTKRAKIDAAHNKGLAEVQNTVYQIIADLAKEKKFQLALPTSQTLFSEDSMDITQDVLNRLNKQLPKLNIKID